MLAPYYRIQMLQDGTWWTIGGKYDAQTADIRVVQFIACCTHNKGQSRQFRVVEG